MNVIKTAIEIDVFEEMKLDENTGEIVLSPSETKLIPLTPISAQSSKKWVITSLVIMLRSFS